MLLSKFEIQRSFFQVVTYIIISNLLIFHVFVTEILDIPQVACERFEEAMFLLLNPQAEDLDYKLPCELEVVIGHEKKHRDQD